MLASVRHIPFLIWDGALDELVPIAGPTAQAQTFDDLGYRYAFDVFPGADHFALAANDSFQPAADFLGTRRVVRNPAHVTYVVNPTMDFRSRGTVANHAYWLSGLRLRDSEGAAPLGTVDAISHAFGTADPVPEPTQTAGGSLPPGNLGTQIYGERSRSWGAAGTEAKRNTLTLTVENLRSLRVNVSRARLRCHPNLDVTTDGPLTVKLGGCHRKLKFG
jgi:hypothetical protein